MPLKVLIVEDEVLVALEIECIVEDLGHVACGIATSSTDAARIARVHKPEVALVDLHLADGLTGPAVGRDLAEAGVKVVFVTANPRLLGLGIPGTLGVVEKPTDERAIAQVVSWVAQRVSGAALPAPPSLLAFS